MWKRNNRTGFRKEPQTSTFPTLFKTSRLNPWAFLFKFPKPMLSSPIDNILVEKAKRQMHLRNGKNIVKTYRISLGKNVGF